VGTGGAPWFVDVVGGFTTTRSGLARTDTALRTLGRAHVLAASGRTPLLVLSPHLPKRGSDADKALRAVGPRTVFDVIELLSEQGNVRLAAYAVMRERVTPLPGFWTESEVRRLFPL